MIKLILTIIFILTTLSVCTSQEVELVKTYYGYRFVLNESRLNMKEFEKVLKPNSEALVSFKKAKSNNVIASILSGAGGFIIGYQLGNAFFRYDINRPLAAIGVGLIVVSIPISVSGTKKMKKAVALYNSSLENTSYYKEQPDFKIVAGGNRIGFTVNF